MGEIVTRMSMETYIYNYKQPQNHASFIWLNSTICMLMHNSTPQYIVYRRMRFGVQIYAIFAVLLRLPRQQLLPEYLANQQFCS